MYSSDSYVKEKSKMILDVPFNKNIRNFAGVRVIVGDDFVLTGFREKEWTEKLQIK